ncbi:MAG: hypothetical protein WBC59_04400 [Phycisphaerae bacterium]
MIWFIVGGIVVLIIAGVILKKYLTKCPYYGGGSFYDGRGCSAGSALGNPMADPTGLMGWDFKKCAHWGGGDCPMKKVSNVFGSFGGLGRF